MSINDDILSRGLKERALLSLYEKKLDTDLTKVMSSHKKRLVNSALKNGNKSVNALNRALTLETRKTYRKIYKNGISELKALANTSSKFHNNTLKESLGKVYRSKVYTGLKVNDLIINSAGTYSEQIASISLTQQRRIKDVVRKGMIDNLAVNKIAKNVGNSIDLPGAQLKTLSRTAITETSSNVSSATYKLNEDVIDGYQYVATLDSRTSMICGRLDGKVFRLNDSRGVRPPQHFNCRSTTVPIVKSYEDLNNTNSSRISKRKLQRISKSKRASFNGQVASETNYGKFLSEQDDNFKLTVLGNKRRVEIFNTGKLKFTQFSTRDGELISIGRLEELLNGVKSTPKVVVPKTVLKTVNPTKVKDVEIDYLLSTGSEKTRLAYQADFNSQLTAQQKVIVESLPKPDVIKNSVKGFYENTYGKHGLVSAKLNDTDLSKYSKVPKDKAPKGYVISHEYGHHIDFVSNNTQAYGWSESSKIFKQAIDKDRKLHKGTGYPSLNKQGETYHVISTESLGKLHAKIGTHVKGVKVYSKWNPNRVIDEITITDLKGDGFGNISDVIDALSRGSFRSKFHAWGHGIDYYSKGGRIELEIFANIFSLQHDKKAYAVLKEIIPNTVKVFEARMLELEKLARAK
jgi:SPP1 gp7 family putative phage head morphogenesis protein